MQISVLGAGAWGTTLAQLLSKKGNKTLLWVREKELFEKLQETRENVLFLPGISLSKNLSFTQDLSEIISWSSIIIFVTPTRFIQSLGKNIASLLLKNDKKLFLNVSKGIEKDSFLTGTFILKNIFGNIHEYAALSGPNIAQEVANEQFSKCVIASSNPKKLNLLKDIFQTDHFRIYCSNDLKGIELAGALKNVVSLALGLCDGLGLSLNTKSALFSRGLYEMTIIGKALGAQAQTFYGLAGVGDLITSSFTPSARNRFTGELLGKGKYLKEIVAIMDGKTSEGIYTVEAVHQWNIKKRLNLPISENLYQLIYLKKDPQKTFLDIWNQQDEEDVCGF